MEGKIEVGGSVREVFDLYRTHAGALLPIAFWLFLASSIVNGLSNRGAGVLALGFVVTAVISTLYKGVVVGLVRDVHEGKSDFRATELLRSALPVLVPLLSAGLLSGMLSGIGLVLLLVPGLYLLTIWAVIAPVIVVEGSAAIPSLGRSCRLVRGNWWRVFGVLTIVFVVAALAIIGLALVGIALANGTLTRIVVSALAATFWEPIQALAASVLYFRLLAVAEAPAPAVTEPPPEPSSAPAT